MTEAVLFLVFNRPQTTSLVFEAIRAARPSRLYVAADGPRATRESEAGLCSEVRRLATDVTWPCQVFTLFRDQNLGCRRAVSGALDWFFSQEEDGIILEDDCLPSPSWFLFASEMLVRYRHDQRIMCVSASHFHDHANLPPYSYFFSRYNHCWGWASWRRAWRYYDHDMRFWPELRETPWLREVGNGSLPFEKHWKRNFEIGYEDIYIDSWATRWTFSCWSQSGITILPSKNLVKNIGVGGDATHTTSDLHPKVSIEDMVFPLIHPPTVIRDHAADHWTDANVYGIGWREFLAITIRASIAKHPMIFRQLQRLRRACRCMLGVRTATRV